MRVSNFLILFLPLLTRSAFASPTVNYCGSSFSEKGIHVQTCGPLHVVRLTGDPVTRARLMGELLRKEILSPSAIQYFTSKVSNVAHSKAGWIAAPVMAIYHQLVRVFHSGAPAKMEEEVDAMAEGMGIDPIVLKRGLSLPDTAVFVHGLGAYPFLHSIPTAGCTSVAARLPGGFLSGRNLDFAGVGVFDKHPMVYVAEPAPGSSELRHVVIGPDGLPFGGITGVNEKGISFAVHQNFTRDISLHGVPMLFAGEALLRQARSLEEAVEILRMNRPPVLWTFVVSDLRSGEILAVESSRTQFHVRTIGSENKFVQTNHPTHPDTRSNDASSLGVETNSNFRMDKALQLLDQAKGISDLAKILAYQEDPLGRLSIHHDILKPETIQTVLIDAPKGKSPTIYVSSGEAPSSSGEFVSFALDDFWKSEDVIGTLVQNISENSAEKRKTQRSSAEAYRLYFDEHKLPEAIQQVADQQSFDAALFRCIVYLQNGQLQQGLLEAENALRDPRFLGEPVYIRDSFQRARLVALLKLGKKDEAVRLASSVLERSSPTKALLELAQMIVRGTKPPKWMTDLRFDFFSGDLSGRKS